MGASARPRRFAWRVGQFRGVEIFVHGTFALLLLWFGASEVLSGAGWGQAARSVLFVLAVFGCVVLHELGHAMVGARFGFPAKDITLYPIGGVARLTRFPENPWQELAIAVAGPAVNLVIALGLVLGLVAAGAWVPMAELDVARGPLLPRLAMVNVALAVFNMIPAFPTDGGRVLRALLTTRTDAVTATDAAARLGRWFAVALGILGVFGNPLLLLIAVFVWVAGAQEASAVRARAATRGVPVAHAMVREFRVLEPEDDLAAAERALLAGSQIDFPVVDRRGRVRGVLRRDALILAAAEQPTALVAQIMEPEVAIADVDEDLAELLDRMAEQEGRPIVVIDGGRLVGLLTVENLGEYLALVKAHTASQAA